MRNIVAVAGFFIGTPLVLLLSLAYLSYLSSQGGAHVLGATTQGIAYAALPPSDVTIQNTIFQEESKEEIVRQFFAQYNSPLEPYAPDIIASSERYGLDFRILPAIAMQESTLCKKVIEDSHNCWGWGIYGGKVTKFDNYPHAIETISKGLSTKYRDRGLITIDEIAKLYNPSNTNYWVENVSHIMEELK